MEIFAETQRSFLRMGQSRPLYRLFPSFPNDTIQVQIEKKHMMVCLGLKLGVAGWKAQTNPLSYDGTLKILISLWNKL